MATVTDVAHGVGHGDAHGDAHGVAHGDAHGVAYGVAPGIARVAVEADPDGRRAIVRTSAAGIRPMLLRCGASSAEVALVAEHALLLAGDDVAIDVWVGSGASLVITEPAGTVAYDMRGGSARWHTRIRLSDKANLVWHGEPFIVSAGAAVHRTLSADVGTGAICLIRDTLVLGREGERPGALRSATRANVAGAPALVEDFAFSAASQVGGVLGPNRVVESLLGLGPVDPGPDSPERLSLEHGGAVWRRLGTTAHTASLAGVWRGLVMQCAATPPAT